jgi:hypothetical protein
VGETDDGFYHVTHQHPVEERHGPAPLSQALKVSAAHVALSACDAELDGFAAEKALFVDAETTGLAGGSGTVAFLVGAGYFDGGVFRVEQCFMRDYDDEEAMLRYLADLFKRFDTVVTFNGKSFDVPLLRTRFIQNRLPFRLDAAGHLDLVHAARRFWRMRLGDCSLGNLERQVLGLHREGDVPSAEIPARWFNYLATRDARPLEGVFYHHHMDILSLVSLLALLDQALVQSQGDGLEFAEDDVSIIKLHWRQKRYDQVIATGKRLAERELDGDMWRECLELTACAHKRLEQWGEAEACYRLILERQPRRLPTRRDLAILYEHRLGALDEAKRLCEETLQYLQVRSGAAHGLASEVIDEFEGRLARIERKLGKSRAP